ncbi:Leucine-rich receptor-like protein kinase family protein [Rhynchospora pubera]|uniref:Leucine-rich receptor-like protein kinase family protein n=1 Tax=Rhynchospora pubera TaxID=906938 RepID=A0AAV8HLK0_9POAL|nr:Leucine-rich receptor-like protein kinase family protein [Rhynchospora pubera]
MNSIESLDLHSNELSGMIPHSLGNLIFLAILNLSYNNLSGKIPVGNQLQTLDDPYIYVGNDYLCGPPLDKSCNLDKVNNSCGYAKKIGEDFDTIFLYLFVVLGVACGFCVIFGVLLFKINWRNYFFFHFVDNWFDRLNVLIAVCLGRLR